MSVPVLSWSFVAQGAAETILLPSARGTRPPALATRGGSGRRSTATGFQRQSPGPDPQSQFISRSYEPILPTSLIYIVLSTRGCSPWRPDAVMSTTRQDRIRSLGFSGTVGGAPDPAQVQDFTGRWALSPDDQIPGPSGR